MRIPPRIFHGISMILEWLMFSSVVKLQVRMGKHVGNEKKHAGFTEPK